MYVAGRTTVTSHERDMDGDARVVARPVTTALAEALAPVPKAPTYALGCLGALTGIVAVGTFLGWVFAGRAFSIADQVLGDGPVDDQGDFPAPYIAGPAPDPGPDLAFLGWISLVALCVTVLVTVVLVRRRNAFVSKTRGQARAEELWGRGWYCHRCGTVHLADDPQGDIRPLTLQEFRQRVWEAGGYGDLAESQPAIG
ncbi:hypothetical protein ABZ990_15960 [Streptomyces sp. NPDC046203]|uniref:hypothetical protein n=1 Tax=Streptomyces sp. NPDC046203 TaxID=3154602 RepID=UPI0033C273FC